MQDLRAHERAVLAMLLAGDVPPLPALREQAKSLRVEKRTHTGVGEYVDLAVSEEAASVEPANFVLDDVELHVVGVEHGVAALLFVEDGRMKFLEFATSAGEWPEEPELQHVTYLQAVPTNATTHALAAVASRHVPTVLWAIAGHKAPSAT